MNNSNVTKYNPNINASFEAVAKLVRACFNAPKFATPLGWTEEAKLLALNFAIERRETKVSSLEEMILQVNNPATNRYHSGAELKLAPEAIIQWLVDTDVLHHTPKGVNGETTWVRSEWAISHLVMAEQALAQREANVGGSAAALEVSGVLGTQPLRTNLAVKELAKGVLRSSALSKTLTEDEKNQIMLVANSPANTFTVPYGYDNRGRIYGRGTQRRADSNAWMRSSIERANPTECGVKGIDAICLQAADEIKCKKGRKARIKAGFAALAEFDVTPANWLNEPTLCRLAIAFKEVRETGRTAVFVYQDATSSGVQHIAALLRSAPLAARVNLLSCDREAEINDLYEAVAVAMGVERKVAKYFVLPRIYGAGDKALFISVLAELGKTVEETKALVGIYLKVEAEIMPEVREFSKTFQQIGGKSQKLEWQLPDGFAITQIEYDKEEHSVRCGRYHTYRKGEYKVSAPAMAGAFPPNLVHSIDAYHMRLVVRWAARNEMEIVPIHDSYGVAPENYDALSAEIRRTFKQVHEEIDILDLMEQATGKVTPVDKGEFDIAQVEHAYNMFC